jgi:hypothetical protein
MTAGYSGTPLAQKLGLARGTRAWFDGMPDSVRAEIDPEGAGVEEEAAASDGIQVAIVFAQERERLERRIAALRPLIQPKGCIWAAWPKKASQVETDITEDVVREVALPMGLVDVKVCAIDATWSGLKLMVRKANR